MKTKNRIKRILSFVPKCKILNDVGCDHGYLGVMCLKNNICEQVVFSDISSRSLDKAKQLVANNKLSSKSVFDTTYGVSSYNNTYDVVAVLGLGGDTIQSIISENKGVVGYYLLQPMTHQVELRRYLISNGYTIKIDEIIKVDSKYYDIMLVQKGNQILTDAEITFGLTNIRQHNEVFKEYLYYKIELLKKSIANIEQNMLQSNIEGTEHKQLLCELALMQSLIKES